MSDQMQRQIRLCDVHSGKMSSDEEAANAITKFNGMDFAADPLQSMRLALSCAVTVESAEAAILGADGITASMGRTKPMVGSECLFHERTRNGQECSAYGAKARERKSAARTAKGKGTTSR